MNRSLLNAFGLLAALLVMGCDPYERREGEFSAGPVDPAKFQTPYLGMGGNPMRAGGTFRPVRAWSGAARVGYYTFPFPAAQAADADPLSIKSDSADDTAAITPPIAYVFDPTPPTSPFPATPKCIPPNNYVFDQQRDAARSDEQGPIFTLLPTAATYAPVVAQVPVTSVSNACQGIKSEATLLNNKGIQVPLTPPTSLDPMAKPTGTPDGNYLAWALIDPSATVLMPDGMPDPSELAPQRIGWYQQYLAVFLDGGYIPTVVESETDPETMTTVTKTRMVAQNIYFPSMMPGTGMAADMVVAGRLGGGQDVLEARRGEPGYSPICLVNTYEPTDPMMPARDVSGIDMATVTPTEQYVYCLQVE